MALFDHKDLKFRFLTDQLIGAEDAGRAGADDDYIIQIILLIRNSPFFEIQSLMVNKAQNEYNYSLS